jgi:fructose-specific phosphotransferase system IIC component
MTVNVSERNPLFNPNQLSLKGVISLSIVGDSSIGPAVIEGLHKLMIHQLTNQPTSGTTGAIIAGGVVALRHHSCTN